MPRPDTSKKSVSNRQRPKEQPAPGSSAWLEVTLGDKKRRVDCFAFSIPQAAFKSLKVAMQRRRQIDNADVLEELSRIVARCGLRAAEPDGQVEPELEISTEPVPDFRDRFLKRREGRR
jgi:hypothetical protein